MLLVQSESLMSINSGRGTPLSGESPLDRRLCAEIGADLARVRAARGLSVAQVSEKLLLSPRQVKALEDVDPSLFHNPTFHVNALRKYAAFAELDPARVAAIATAVASPSALAAETSAVDADAPGNHGLGLVASVLAVAAAVALGGYFLWGRQPAPAAPPVQMVVPAPSPEPAPVAVPTPEPPAPTPPETPVPAPEAAPAPTTPPPAAPVAADASAFGAVRVQRPTWVFVRDAENAVTERSLGQGESLTLESQPTYLAVGTPDVELLVAGRRVDLSRFVTNGQVRMRAGDFDAIAQGMSPVTAPTRTSR